MIFYKGMNFDGPAITVVPGFASSRPEEAAEYAVPALYKFEFDRSKLVIVPTVNGMDNNATIKGLAPGAIGADDNNEVIINVPVPLQLVTGTDLLFVLDEIRADTVASDAVQTLHYFVEVVLDNINIYKLRGREQELLAHVAEEY